MNIKEKAKEAKANAQAWWYGFTYRQEQRMRDFGNWASQNKELAIALIPVGIVAFREVGKTIRTISENAAEKEEARQRDLRIYDNVEGRYIYLRRPMTRSEQMEYAAIDAWACVRIYNEVSIKNRVFSVKTIDLLPVYVILNWW